MEAWAGDSQEWDPQIQQRQDKNVTIAMNLVIGQEIVQSQDRVTVEEAAVEISAVEPMEVADSEMPEGHLLTETVQLKIERVFGMRDPFYCHI